MLITVPTVIVLVDENCDLIYRAAMMGPHSAAELDLRQTRHLVDDLLAAYGGWVPVWCQPAPAA